MTTLHTALLISLACLGFRAITDKGMILYFLRGWIDRLKERIKPKSYRAKINEYIDGYKSDIKEMNSRPEDWKVMYYEDNTEKYWSKSERIKQWEEKLNREYDNLKKLKYNWFLKLAEYLAKPVLTCSTCMASVHTLIWFPIITGELYTYKLVLTMLIVAFLNTIGWLAISTLRSHLK